MTLKVLDNEMKCIKKPTENQRALSIKKIPIEYLALKKRGHEEEYRPFNKQKHGHFFTAMVYSDINMTCRQSKEIH